VHLPYVSRAMDIDDVKRLTACMYLLSMPLGMAAAAQPQAAPSLSASPGAPSAAVTQPGGSTQVGTEYVIGPGDSLQVFVWRNPELSSTVPVRPDGKISTPLVEDMTAVGKTPAQLARDIEAKLAVYVKLPQVNVIVTQALSAFSQVKVIGQVQHPQGLPYREGMTVLDAVLQVGGLMPFAAGNRSKIIRVDDGKQHDIKIKLEALINQGDMKQNLALKPGDVLVVPQTRF
jgi:polysaccharide biosynthesis/export protein